MSFVATNRKPLSRYVPRQRVRQDPPVPPRWIPPPPGFARPPLSQFFILSMLLHALAIALFGAPSGGSREGRAMWGGFNVVLKEYREPPPKLKMAQELAPVPRVERRAERRAEPRRESKKREEGYLTVPLKRETALPTLQPPPVDLPQAPLPLPPEPAPLQRAIEPTLAPAPLPQPILPPLSDVPVVPPVQRAPVQAPRIEVPAVPVPPLESVVTPPRIEPLLRPVEPAALPDVPMVQEAPKLEPPKLEPPKPEPRVAPPPAAIERVEPRIPAPAPAPRIEAPLPRVPPKPADEAYDPTAPGLDVDALRKRAGEMARQGSGQRAVLPFPMPPIPKAKSEMEVAIEKARKPDCRTAYSALGLAAVVPLIANEFGEGNCRW